MPRGKLQYSPIDGKTYTLFGNSGETSDYYKIIKRLADKILEKNPAIISVIETINQYSSKKRYLKKILKNSAADNLIEQDMKSIEISLYRRGI